MKINQKGIDLIKHFESLHDGDLKTIGLQPKMCPSGIWTEGWGRTIKDSKGKFVKGIENKTLAYKLASINTELEAEKALKEDLLIFEKAVLKNIKVPLNENQFSALVSYWYNTGGSNTLVSLINNKASKEEIYKWITTKYITGQGSKIPLSGLVKRRKAEADLYFS
jgi:lysozyme